MISFAIGHIVYFIALLLLADLTPPFSFLVCHNHPISVGILFLKADENKFRKFLAHAITYTVILTFMSIYTIALSIYDTRYILMAVGMVLFLLSDLVLSPMYFAGKQDDKVLCVINHTLYYAAQICIATFLFFI